MKKRWISALVAAMLLVNSVAAAATGSGSTAAAMDWSGHWAHKTIEKWVGLGLATGYQDGSFKADHSVTRAEFTALVNRTFGFTYKGTTAFRDVTSGSWYADEVARGVEAGYLSGYADSTFKPNASITRAEAAKVVATLLQLDTVEAEKTLSKFSDEKSLPAWSRGYISAAAGNGYLAGYPGGTFSAAKSITRAEALTVLNRAAGELDLTAGTYGGDNANSTYHYEGNVTVGAAGTILQNAQIVGSLIISAGVADGDVTLKNVKVTGKTVIYGGGSHSVHIEDSSLGDVLVQKTGGQPPRLVLSDASEIGGLYFGTSDSVIEIGKAASIGYIEASKPVNIKGTGTIGSLKVTSPGVVTEQKPGSLAITGGLTAAIAGETAKESYGAAADPTGETTASAASGGSGVSSSTSTWTGWLLDYDCVGANPKTHTQDCNLMPSCIASGLGVLLVDGTSAGEWIPFDAASQSAAEALDLELSDPSDATKHLSLYPNLTPTIQVKGYTVTTGLPSNITDYKTAIHITSIDFSYISGVSSYEVTTTRSTSTSGTSSSSTSSSSTSTSDASSGSTSGTSVPGEPTEVSAVRYGTQATVSFQAPSANGGSAITGYTVTAYTGGSATALTASGTASPITVTGLDSATDYTFRVTAANAVGSGNTTYEATPSVAVLETHTGWVICSNCLGANIVRHTKNCCLMSSCVASGLGLYQYTDGVSTTSALAGFLPFDGESTQAVKNYLNSLSSSWSRNLSVSVTGYVVHNIPANTTDKHVPETDPALITEYLDGFHVVSIDPYEIPAYPYAPSAPAISSAVVSGTTAAVTFTAPTYFGTGITGYEVWVYDSTGNKVDSLTTAGAASSTTPLVINVSGLTEGASYQFAVVATYQNGYSAPSGQVAGTAATPAP